MRHRISNMNDYRRFQHKVNPLPISFPFLTRVQAVPPNTLQRIGIYLKEPQSLAFSKVFDLSKGVKFSSWGRMGKNKC